jgi:hypothetical protein
MDHGIEGPKEFDLFKDVRKKKINGRIVWRFRADLLSACKPVFDDCATNLDVACKLLAEGVLAPGFPLFPLADVQNWYEPDLTHLVMHFPRRRDGLAFLCRLNSYIREQYEALTRRRDSMNEPHRITIRSRGEGNHRRFVLMDRRERYWTGTRWTRDPGKALLHANMVGAYREYQRIMEERHRDRPVREFEAVIRVRVFADGPFSLEVLGDFLGAATQINVDPERLGDGPVDGCLVLQRADFTTLKEVTGSPVGPRSTVIPPRAT